MAVQAHQQQNLVGLSFCASQDWMDFGGGGGGVGNGGGFTDFCQPLQLQQQQQQQGQEEYLFRNQIMAQLVDPSYHLSSSMGFYQSFGLQAEKQRMEIDRLIALQNERLRLALQQQRKQQLSVFLSRLESKALNMLRQKDEDIAKAGRKAMELEECIRKVELENQAWQRVAKESESMVIALNNTLEQVRENVGILSSSSAEAAEDAESCCQSSQHHEPEDSKTREQKMVCKGCNSRNSCVLFLPCRHLCSCKACEAFLGSCPVCKSVKKACIEVFVV